MKKQSSQNPANKTTKAKSSKKIPNIKNTSTNPTKTATQAHLQQQNPATTNNNPQNLIPNEIINAFETKDFNRTIALCTAFLQENPSSPQVWFICGMSLYYLANFPRAIESLQIALTLAPQDEKIAFNLAEILRQKGNALAAIEILSAFVPCKNGDVYYNLARALSTQAEVLNAKNLADEKNSPKMNNLQNLTTSQNRKSAQNLTTKDNPAHSKQSISLESLTNPQYFINPYQPPTTPHPQATLLLNQAKQAYKNAIELNPLDKDAMYNLANLYAKDNQYSEAIALYELCGTLNAKLNLAFLYNKIDEGKKACAIYAHLESGFAKECGFLPLSIEGESFDKEALDSYFRSNILPNMPKNPTNKHLDTKSYRQSIASLEKIASYKSHIETQFSSQKEHISQFYFNYANTARYAGFNMLSFYLYGCAYCLSPNALCAINYAHLALSLQNFSLGFKLYEERLALKKADAFNAEFFALPNYLDSLSGTPKELQAKLRDSKVLIFGEQGLGDMIMFGRFIDRLKSQCDEVYLYVRDELKSLFSLRYKVVESDFRDFDYCISAMSLAYILGVESLSDFNANENYLSGIINASNVENLIQTAQNQAQNTALDSNKLLKSSIIDVPKNLCKNFHSNICKIGFFFASTSGSSNARDKSIPLDSILSALFGAKNTLLASNLEIELHCLQPESLLQQNAKEIAKKFQSSTTKNAKNRIKTKTSTKSGIRFYDLANFLDTAKIMSGLDIFISIDSAPAHLAIALGVPCIVVAHKRYDWRWEEIGKNISLQENGIKGSFSGLCGGEVLAQGKNGDWRQVSRALEVYLQNFIRHKI